MAKSKKKLYVVWNGITPGIYADWDECKKQIANYPGALYKAFSSRSEAEQAYQDSAWNHIGKKQKKQKTGDTLHPEIITESISVDAACSGNPGNMEYRGVYTLTGEEVFKQGPFKQGTNNIGEFLALVHAMAFMKTHHKILPIYSDSKTGISWVKAKKVKTKLTQTENNKEIFALIRRAEQWLAHNDISPFKIIKWKTEQWGEIPADFGRK